MRLSLAIKSGSTLSWDELVADRPASFRAERRGDELVLYTLDAMTTGVRLRREGGAHVVEVPAFASFDELTMARGVVALVAKVGGGTIHVSDNVVSREQFSSIFDDQIAIQFACRCLDVLAALRNGESSEVFTVEGVRRPFFIGTKTVARILALAHEGDAYQKVATIVHSIQSIAHPTELPEPFSVRTPDGETASYAMWDPRRETLLPPCDYLLVRESETIKVRVSHDRIAEVVAVPGHADTSYGVPIDERQWLLGQQDEPTARLVVEQASRVGRRLKMRDPGT